MGLFGKGRHSRNSQVSSGQMSRAQRCFDTVEQEYRQFVVPDAEKIFGSPLPRSVASELEKVYVHFVMRGVLASGEWKRVRVLPAGEAVPGILYSPGKNILRLLAQAHPAAASFASLITATERGTPLFAESAALTDKVCGVFWRKCIEAAAKALTETGCLDGDEVECFEAEDILKRLHRIEACFRPENDAVDAEEKACRGAFTAHLRAYVSAHSPVPYGTHSPMEDTTEYVYCTVAVPGIEKSYSYLAGDAEYAPGDRVTVPFGRENELRTGEVIAVQRCTAADAPYPPARTKTVLGKADE